MTAAAMRAAVPAAAPVGGGEVEIAGVMVVADAAGALFWPDEGLLVIADLHLEKGSSYAARGVLLPPYDTAATLGRLAQVLVRYAPRAVIALGDSFHDGKAPARLADTDRHTLHELQRGRDWFWIAGNHDPAPAAGVGSWRKVSAPTTSAAAGVPPTPAAGAGS